MASQEKLDATYIGMARLASELSHARRRKVGAILVVPGGGRYEGFNGTPAGFDNNCENAEMTCRHDWIRMPSTQSLVCCKCQESLHDRFRTKESPHKSSHKLVTKPEVLHAESNAIAKIACSTDSSIGATMYCTLSPCVACAKLMIQCKIVRFVYGEVYRAWENDPQLAGIELLLKAGIRVDTVTIDAHNTSG